MKKLRVSLFLSLNLAARRNTPSPITAEHGNQYAAQLLHSIQSNRNWGVATASIRLLHHISRMIQNHIEDERKNRATGIDRKLRRKIDEKKQAHDLKQG